MNDIERIFKQLQICETFEPCDVVERLGHFDGIASSLACIPTKQHGVRGGKYLLNTPGDAISEILNFTMSLDALALENVRLWYEFQSRLLFIISLLLKNVLTALSDSAHMTPLSTPTPTPTPCYLHRFSVLAWIRKNDLSTLVLKT